MTPIGKKKDYSINGDHRRLGRSFDMGEFKGYTISEISNINKTLVRIEEGIKDNREDINALKQFKTKIMAYVFAVGVIGAATWEAVKAFIFG